MLLAIDVGNTHITLGIFAERQLLRHWTVGTDRNKTADEYGLLLAQLLEHGGVTGAQVEAVAICSVVPPLTPILEAACQSYFGHKALAVGPGTRTGLVIRYENPREVGADRIVLAVAAIEKYGAPCIVVDLSGTATILDYISAAGEYLGGVIAPGVEISAEALFEHASKLPRVELVRPQSVLGRNTVACMQSGIVFGFAGQVDELVRRLTAELGPATVVATGEVAALIAPEARSIQHVDPFLTLDGLRIIHERNRSAAGRRPSRGKGEEG